ncbi:MAG: LysM peptidoglycan-binding domain-containing protein [Bacteriovoracaceae bacterium]|nr:LysM peptidoglycan-binding domain-containing protein [Bacteriovoracaceae bacterium]
MRQRTNTFIFSIITYLLLFANSYAQENNEFIENFPIKGEVETRVNFWVKVYTEITTQEAFLHDSEDLGIIYNKYDLPSTGRSRVRFIREVKANYRKMLQKLAKSTDTSLNEEEKQLKAKLGERSSKEYYQLAKNLRFQYGLKDRYYQGLIRSYRYLDYIQDVFASMDMPEELKFLPHVESSFNYLAYSKVGAAGIWQFMRSTARIYKLKVGYVVDERRDVIKATKAAAKLLKDNYRLLKSWPLALTAYNHGARSIKNAINKLQTSEIHKIIEGYDGRRFGFASKNFYATFMATVLISKDPEKYFKSFKKPDPFTYSTLTIKKPLTVKQLSDALNLSIENIGDYNPSIRRAALKSPLFLPSGFVLYLPQTTKDQIDSYEVALNKLESKFENLKMERLHIVSRGESLFDISKGYKVSLNDLIAFNNIINPSRIYAGMKLKIPGEGSEIKTIQPKLAITEVRVPKEETPKKNQEFVAEKSTRISYGPSESELKGQSGPNLEGYALELTRIKGLHYQIEIETEETLGHLAEWANIRTQKIRDWNKLSFGGLIFQGQKLNLFLNDEQAQQFGQQRNAYHLSIQEDFYENFQISKVDNYNVNKGDNLNGILEKFNVPFWLMRSVQEGGKLDDRLSIGQVIKVPMIDPKSEESGLIIEE